MTEGLFKIMMVEERKVLIKEMFYIYIYRTWDMATECDDYRIG